jgi:hypothetical protein
MEGQPMSRLRIYSIELTLVAILLSAVGFFAYLGSGLMQSSTEASEFSGARAFNNAVKQLEFGPRITGTDSSLRMSDWLTQELARLGWDVLIEPFTISSTVQARNIIAIRRSLAPDALVAIIGAHYDTRLIADVDPDPANRTLPTPGANSGASGPAILLELARTLDPEAMKHTVCLVFFDGDDNANLPGWTSNQGSLYFLEHLESSVPQCGAPQMAVMLDLVGNAQQQIFMEQTGTPTLNAVIWQVAASLGYGDRIHSEMRWSAPGAHTLFIQRNIPAIVIADFDYAHRHTLEDTLNKLDADSLAAVGRTLEVWLESGAPLTP